MIEEIHNPLRDYREIYRDKFIEAAERAFDQFSAAANVDVEANRETCNTMRSLEETLKKVKRSLTWWWVLAITLWVLAAGSFALYFMEVTDFVVPIAIFVAIAAFQIFFTHKKISQVKKHRDELQKGLDETVALAYSQMAPLNNLYDEEIFHRLVHEVTPIVSLDSYLKAADMQILAEDFGWRNRSDNCSSAINVQSGKINGNPFLICRRLVHTMGSKTYTGSKTVTVTKTRYVNGKTERYTTSEVLTASVTKPFPEYNDETEIIYGNQAAPELSFSRKKNHFKNKEGSLSYKFAQWKLKRKANNMDQDFALMTNEEFEVLFTTTDRNNNQQYALLFTPVAQANIIDLIRDEEQTGFGDDFCFYKTGRVNTIIADHMQVYDLEWSPARYSLFEYDKAKEAFIRVNLEAFKGLYFGLAPLLSIPLYQQMRPTDDVRMHRPLDDRCDTLQHEVLAYYWGQANFKHPESVTNNILKTYATPLNDGSTQVNVVAFGYRSIPRVTYVSVRDSNGRSHQVPVHWDEYLPVEGTGAFSLKETAGYPADATTPQERYASASQRLKAMPGAVLYKHIATWLGVNGRMATPLGADTTPPPTPPSIPTPPPVP